jgi:hypothetical protein
VTKVTRADASAQPAVGETNEELCVVLKLPGDDRDVSARIGSSPDRPATPPAREDAVLLLRTTTTANVNDLVDVAGLTLRVTAISPGYDSVGKLAYHVVQAAICETRPGELGGE